VSSQTSQTDSYSTALLLSQQYEIMPIEKLDHVNVRTAQLEKMIEWYTSVLGLRSGDRPDFPFAGAWLYAGNTVTVHLIEIKGEPGAGSEVDLKLEHFAFAAKKRIEFEKVLESKMIPHRKSNVPDMNLVQYNIWDPDGNHIHVDFAADE